jgi:hypothetical protein
MVLTATTRRLTPAGFLLKGQGMSHNRTTERLRRLKKTPVYNVTAWQLNWHNEPKRRDVANQMTWLGWTDHDAPIRKAFEFFGLDERDPRHWRILTTYLAFVMFPNPKSGTRLETIQQNAELLAHSLEFPKAKTDTEIIKALKSKYRSIYGGKNEANLRKRLKAARRRAGHFA